MDTYNVKENNFKSHDDSNIFYRSWTNENNKKAAILLHRGHEHSLRIAHLVDELKMEDTNFFAWDARGNGKTEGVRGYSPDFSYLVKDLDVFVKHIIEQYGINEKDIIIIAQSVGAVIASVWIHDYAPKIKGAILASPAFNVNLIIPGAKQALQFWQKIKGNHVVKSYVKGKDLTHDIERSESYHNDSLVSLDIYSNVLLELYENTERVVYDAGAIVVPILLLTSGDDKVVYKKEQKIFFDNLSSKIKKQYILEGFYHDTLGEKDRIIAINYIKDFINEIDKNTEVKIDLSDADKKGYTYNEFVKLSKPLNTFSLKNINFKLIRFSLKTIGKFFSNGIAIAEKTGHDSGSTLDCVYENDPKGRLFIGKIIDKAYLNSIGWQGIRLRKSNIGKAINFTVERIINKGLKVRILDIAAGHGRYIIDAIIPLKNKISSVLLRDYSDINVKAGSELIKEKGLENIVEFINGNAFDKESLSSTEPKPTIAIVSGLYELFPDNNLLRDSLGGIYQALEKDGYLIYTNQPWHPQVELIARTLTSHRQGQDWVMRRRTQAEMDNLVENAGFEKIEQFIDKWGIFSVSIAKK